MLGASNYPRRGRYGMTTAPSNTGTATGTSNTFLVRPRLPLRSYSRPKTTANLLGVDSAGYGRSKRLKSRKINGYQKADTLGKKKAPDYTDFAYREAVSKLKYLLAESYTPRITPRKLLHGGGGRFNNSGDSNPKINIESGDDTDDRSIASEVSQTKTGTLLGNLPPRSSPYLPRPKNSQLSRGCSNLALLSSRDPQSAPPELMSFIERQEEYIEQLERESQYCRDELTNLLGKVREVVAENETLNDKNKNGFLKSVMEEYNNNSDEENREPKEQSRSSTLDSKGKRVKLQKILEGPSIVFESRISELEAQLTQARVELRKVQEENQANLRRLTDNGGGECVPELKTQLERALRDKRDSEMKLEEVQRSLSSVRDREADTAHKAKRTLDVLEQAQFEKTQAEAEMRRLRDELDRQHERLREASQEASRRVAEERHQIERRFSQQVEQLTSDVASHWDVASKSQLEAEKQRREISDLRRELAQKQSLIDELKKELQSKISSMQSDLSQAVAEKDAAEQEISASKLSNERAERQARQEQNRLQSEINSYKQRLERADADLVHCRRENLRLSEQISSLEKEVNLNKMVNSEDHRTPGVTPRGPPTVDNDKELTSMIMDIETKHATTVAGLEDAMANQASVVSQLSIECQSLTQRLEANSLKHNTRSTRCYSVLTEGDEPAIAMTSSSPTPRKKRTVKVDLKVKVVPKKKSARSDNPKTPLSAQEEMASLQDNLNYLTSQIQDSLVHQNDNPNYDTSQKTQPPYPSSTEQAIHPTSKSEPFNNVEDVLPSTTTTTTKSVEESGINDFRGNEGDEGMEKQELVEDLNPSSLHGGERTAGLYNPDELTSEQRYNPSEIKEQGNVMESDYKIDNYDGVTLDNQTYDPQYTDQSYEQYNQYNQEQYQPEDYEQQGGVEEQTGQLYDNPEMYENMQYNDQQQHQQQDYQNYPSEYNEAGDELQEAINNRPEDTILSTELETGLQKSGYEESEPTNIVTPGLNE